jgi:hypothetical protein
MNIPAPKIALQTSHAKQISDVLETAVTISNEFQYLREITSRYKTT